MSLRTTVLGLFLTLSFTTAFAGNTWDGGGGDNLWGTGANWDGDTAPGTGTNQDLNFAGTTRLTPQNNYGNWSDFRSIFFNSGAGAFIINGNPVDLWVADGSGKIENNSSNTQTINFDSFSINGGNYEMNPVSGNLSVTSNNIFTNGRQIHVYGNQTLSFGASTVISQGGGLVILGGGTVIFQSAHTFTGQSYINSGTLRINPGGSADSSTLNLGDTFGSSNATLLLGGNNMSLSSAVNVRSGNTGSMTINASGSNLTLSGGITLNRNAAITAGAGNDLTISGAINTNGNTLDKLGAGNLTLTSTSNDANNRYYLGAGTLNVSAQTNLGNRATFGNKFYFDGGILNATASFTIQGNNGITFAGSGGRISVASGQTLTIQSYINDIDATNDFIKSGTGTLFLDKSDTNDFSHTTIRVYEGTLSTWNPGGLLSSTVQLGDTATSGTYQFTKTDGAVTADKTFSIAAGGGSINVTNDALSLGTGNLTGAGTFTKLGDGTLTVSGASNSHSGAVVVSAGSLALTSAISSSGFTLSGGNLSTSATNQLANTATLTVNTGTFTLGGADTVGAISGSGGTINLGANALTTDTASSSSYSGTITGTGGSLTKNGTGTLTLSGANSFSGGVTLNAGQLNINTATAIGNGTLAINGGTIDNTSAASITLSNNNAQSWNGNFTFAGTKDLNMGTGTITLGANRTVTVASGNLTLAASTFSGGFFITKNGSGTLDIGNVSRTWASGGGFFINSGTLAMTAGNNLGTIPNANQLIFTGNSTLRVQDSSSIASGRGILINSGVTATIDASVAGAPFRFESVISGAGSLIKTGVGTALIDAANTYTGSTTLSAGTLQIGAGGTRGSLSTSSSIINNAFLTFNRTDTVTQGTHFASGISGTGELIQNGSGSLVLNGSNTYTGNTTVSRGTLTLGANNAIASSSNLSVSSGAAFNLANFNQSLRGISGAGNITLGSGTLTSDNANSSTFSGILSGSGGSLTKLGAGTLTLSGTSANTFNGSTTINAGTLSLGKTDGVNAIAGHISIGDGSGSDVVLLLASNQIADSSVVTMSGTVALERGGFYLNGFNETIGGLSGDGLVQVEASSSSAASTLTLNVGSDLSFTSNAFIRNTATGNSVLSITKTGAGTQIFSDAANAYTGATTINGGNLSVSTLANGGSASNIGSSSAAAANLVLGGGTLRYTGSTASTDRAFTLTAATTSAIDVSNSATTLTISGASASTTGALVKTGAGALTLSGANSWSGGTTLSAGTLNINHATAIGSGTFTIGAGTTLDNTSGSSITLSNNNAQAWNGNFTFTGTNALNLGTGTIALGGNLTVAVNGNTLTAGNISGTNTTLTKSGSGTLVLTDVNRSAWTGGVVLQAGTLGITNGINLGALPGSPAAQLTFSGNSTLRFQGSTGAPVGANRVFSIDSGVTATIDTQSFNVSLANAVQGDGSLAKNGVGSLTLSASNSFSGGITLSAGTLRLQNAGAAGTGTLTQASGASLLAIDTTGTLANAMSLHNVAATQSATLSGGLTVNNATFDVAEGNTLELSGGVGGSGGVTKNGTGTLVLSGSNTYSGNTTINAGILNAANANALGTNATVRVNGGSLLVSTDDAINSKNLILASSTTGNGTAASLVFSGTYNGTAGSLTLNQDSIIDLGTGSVVVHFADLFMSTHTLSIYNWTGTTLWAGGNGNNTDQFYIDRTLTGSELNNISFYSGIDNSSFVGTAYQLSGGSFNNQVIPVPEPETYATAVLLLLGGAIWTWRRRAISKNTLGPSCGNA